MSRKLSTLEEHIKPYVSTQYRQSVILAATSNPSKQRVLNSQPKPRRSKPRSTSHMLSLSCALSNLLIRQLIDGYFTVVKETACDQVPKLVMTYLVIRSSTELARSFSRELVKQELIDQIVCEDEDIRNRREVAKAKREGFRECLNILSAFRCKQF